MDQVYNYSVRGRLCNDFIGTVPSQQVHISPGLLAVLRLESGPHTSAGVPLLPRPLFDSHRWPTDRWSGLVFGLRKSGGAVCVPVPPVPCTGWLNESIHVLSRSIITRIQRKVTVCGRYSTSNIFGITNEID